MSDSARAAILHLRMPFVYVLSPIYVWGAYWAPGGWSGRTTLGFLLVHLALYPGANAFNSAYDRDEGPIGGLARPPRVPRGLARASTLLQVVGLLLAPLVGLGFALAYAALWGIFTAYSHPRIRWKRSPAGSTLAITVGQGGLGWALGWSAAGGAWFPEQTGLWSLAAACAIVAALYPLTQAYQIADDSARSESTLAAVLGSSRTFAWVAAGLAGLAIGAWRLERPVLAATALGAAVLALVAARLEWAPGHRETMALLYANSTAFLIYLITTWGM